MIYFVVYKHHIHALCSFSKYILPPSIKEIPETSIQEKLGFFILFKLFLPCGMATMCSFFAGFLRKTFRCDLIYFFLNFFLNATKKATPVTTKRKVRGSKRRTGTGLSLFGIVYPGALNSPVALDFLLLLLLLNAFQLRNRYFSGC
jgi:hypothetical protein